MKETALELAKIWANNNYFDENDRADLNNLLSDYENNESEITESFYQDLEFGTGGLRSVIGFGSNRMNKYNIRKATQAMCNIANKDKEQNLVSCVSYDNRRFSKEFAFEVASVFAANGIKCFIYNDLTPTPMLSYAVRYFNAKCGVMVTASHNPKQYNGFKAYWSDGAQVVPPEDQIIIDEYLSLKDWNQIKHMDFDIALKENMIEFIGDNCIDSFFQITRDQVINRDMCKEHGDKVHFIYTPLHGTGYHPCERISKELGFSNFEIVQSQAVFDSEFSTIKSTPNPEDPIALELAVALMQESNADIAYGTDPDCDRLGVVVNHKGMVHYLNGNQIAILMLDYILTQKSEKNILPKNPLILKSIVTSPLQKTIADQFNATVIDTLTGFKWMAKKWRELEENQTKYNFLFASEESFGYMPHDKVRDKDAIASIAIMNEISLFNKLEGKTLIDALDSIYERYGYAEESLIALNFEGIAGKTKIQNIMEYFRAHKNQSIADNKIVQFSDYSTLIQMDFIHHKENKIDMTASNVLQFLFENGNRLFVRPSGTEPKIKFYTMVQVSDGDLNSKKEKAKEQIQFIEAFIHKIVEGL